MLLSFQDAVDEALQSPPLILVTGGAGFIGSHTVGGLLEKGYRVRVFDDLSGGSKANLQGVFSQIEWVEADVRDPFALLAAAQGVQGIIHLAALPSVTESMQDPQRTHDVNVNGTVHVLEAARKNHVSKVVFASSAAVYGPAKTLPQHEGLDTNPVSPYGLHKLMGEQYGKLYQETFGVKTICLRYFNVFGPRQNPQSPYSGVISIFSDTVLKGKEPTVYGDGLQSRDFVHVSDVVQANLLALEANNPSPLVLNVASGRSSSLLRLLKILENHTGNKLKVHFAPDRRGDIRDSAASIENIQAELGYTPTMTLEDGLAEFIHSLRDLQRQSA